MEDTSQDYGEERVIAIGFLDASLYVLVYEPIEETRIRAISPRKTIAAERLFYAEH